MTKACVKGCPDLSLVTNESKNPTSSSPACNDRLSAEKQGTSPVFCYIYDPFGYWQVKHSLFGWLVYPRHLSCGENTMLDAQADM